MLPLKKMLYPPSHHPPQPLPQDKIGYPIFYRISYRTRSAKIQHLGYGGGLVLQVSSMYLLFPCNISLNPLMYAISCQQPPQVHEAHFPNVAVLLVIQ